MYGPVDREDAGRAIDGGEGDVKPGRLGRRGRRGQVEENLGGRPDEAPGSVGNIGLAIVPVVGVAAGPHRVTDPRGILVRVGQECGPIRRGVVGCPARVGRQDAAVGRHVVLPVVEFVRVPVRDPDVPNCGAEAQGGPSDRTEVQGLSSGYGDVRLFIGADHAGAESPEVVGAGRHVGDAETPAGPSPDPVLVGQVLLLEVHPSVDGRQPDPKAHRRASGVGGIGDREGSAHRSPAGGLGIGRTRPAHRLGVEPGVGPGALLGGCLRLRVGPKDPGLQGNGVAGGTGVLIGVDEGWAEGLGREGACRLVPVGTEPVMTTPEHVQQRVADVLGEFTVHGPAVQELMAGKGLPDPVGRTGGGPPVGVHFSQGGAVGVLALGGPRVDPAGPLPDFRRGARHGHVGGIGIRHLSEAVGVHAQPVEERAHVHVGAQFAAWVIGVVGLVGEDHRVVDALLPAEQVVINGHVHGVRRRLEPHFRLVTAVVGGVHAQRINGVRQGGPARTVEVKISPTVSSGQEVGPVIGEVGDVPVALVKGE